MTYQRTKVETDLANVQADVIEVKGCLAKVLGKLDALDKTLQGPKKKAIEGSMSGSPLLRMPQSRV